MSSSPSAWSLLRCALDFAAIGGRRVGLGGAVLVVADGRHAREAADPAHALHLEHPELEVVPAGVQHARRAPRRSARASAASAALALGRHDAAGERDPRAVERVAGQRRVVDREARARVVREVAPVLGHRRDEQHRVAVGGRAVDDERAPRVAVLADASRGSRRSSRRRACAPPPRRRGGAGSRRRSASVRCHVRSRRGYGDAAAARRGARPRSTGSAASASASRSPAGVAQVEVELEQRDEHEAPREHLLVRQRQALGRDARRRRAGARRRRSGAARGAGRRPRGRARARRPCTRRAAPRARAPSRCAGRR